MTLMRRSDKALDVLKRLLVERAQRLALRLRLYLDRGFDNNAVVALLNLWSYVKWCHLFVPDRGPRQVLHHLLPLARWRLWLWEMVKQRLGFSLDISVPLAV